MDVSQTARPNVGAANKQRILVVDDVEVNRIVTQAILKSAAYDVEVVEDGAAALQALEARDYDLVLLDLEMPGLDGHETARRIQGIENGTVRLAALTASKRIGLREDSADIGLDAHLERPIDPLTLLREIALILDQPQKPHRDAEPWDRPMYKELVRRLGPMRMRGLLIRLSAELETLMMMLSWPDEGEALQRRAHDLASVAGMLGFSDVTRHCRVLMGQMGKPEEPAARADLATAAVAALTRLTAFLAIEPENDAA